MCGGFDRKEGSEVMPERKTATYKALEDSGGYRFIFYGDLSGAHVCTTKEIYCGNTQEEALQAAWQAEGRKHFNQCRKCGKWVSLAMYNVDVLECVECAPFEAEAKFCKNCGTKIEEPIKPCPTCGKPLTYSGKEWSK